MAWMQGLREQSNYWSTFSLMSSSLLNSKPESCMWIWTSSPMKVTSIENLFFSPWAHPDATWSTKDLLVLCWLELHFCKIYMLLALVSLESIGQNAPGITVQSPGSQNPLVLPGSEHNSKLTTMKRHSSAREYCGNSNLLLQIHFPERDA